MKVQTLLVTVLVAATISFARSPVNWDEVSSNPDRGFGGQRNQQDFNRNPQQQRPNFRRNAQATQQFGSERFCSNCRSCGSATQRQGFRGMKQEFTPQKQNYAPQQYAQGRNFGASRGRMNAPYAQQNQFRGGQPSYQDMEKRQFMQKKMAYQRQNYAPQQYAQGRNFGASRGSMNAPYAQQNQYRGEQPSRQDMGKRQFQQKQFAYPNAENFNFEESKGRDHDKHNKHERNFDGNQRKQKRNCQKSDCSRDSKKTQKSRKSQAEHKERAHKLEKGDNEHPTADPKEIKMKLRDAVMEKDYDKAIKILNHLKKIEN